MKKFNTLMNMLLVITMGLFYGRLVFLDELSSFISPMMNPFSWILLAFILLLLLVNVYVLIKGGRLSFKKRYAIYFFPLLLYLVTGPATLGKGSIQRKKSTPGIQQENLSHYEKKLKEYGADLRGDMAIPIRITTGKEFAYFIKKLYKLPERYTGRQVIIQGIYYIDTDLNLENQAMVGRYIVSCCVADARISGFVIQFEDKPAYKENDWIEVTTVMNFAPTKPGTFPVFNVIEHRKLEKLKPYIYPLIRNTEIRRLEETLEKSPGN